MGIRKVQPGASSVSLPKAQPQLRRPRNLNGQSKVIRFSTGIGGTSVDKDFTEIRILGQKKLRLLRQPQTVVARSLVAIMSGLALLTVLVTLSWFSIFGAAVDAGSGSYSSTNERHEMPAVGQTIDYKVIRIERGDTLWRLAGEYGQPDLTMGQNISMLQKLNGMKGTFLRQGSTFKVPAW